LTKLLTTFSGQFGNVGAADLAASPALAHLEQLDLSGNRLGWRAAEAIARSPYLKRLEYLDLGGNHLGKRGAQALAAGHFPRLRHLDVRFSAIPAAGIAALARSPAFPALHYLALADNGLNNDAVNALCESDRLRELRWLDLEKARLSRRNLDRLRERFGAALRV
jgi:Ran GTPase-activating protein (RanGAP) involved in mRNA processing and transport